MKNALKLLIGSIVVYGLVVACSGEDDYYNTKGKNSLDEEQTQPFKDRTLNSKVSTAYAAEPPPTIDHSTQPCNKSYHYDSPEVRMTYFYAEQQFPGKDLRDVAKVRAYYKVDYAPLTIPGYTHQKALPQLADGKVAVYCGATTYYTETGINVDSRFAEEVMFDWQD